MLKLIGSIKKAATGQKLSQAGEAIVTLQLTVEAELDGEGPATLRDLVEMQQNGDVEVVFKPVQGRLPVGEKA
jgi:hypothetical protein